MNNGDQKYVVLTEILPKNHVNTEIPTTSIVGPAKKCVIRKIALIKALLY